MSAALARALVLGAGLLAGCTAFASKSDYIDYRAQRMAADDEARLVAMQHYVARHPDGRWYDEVQRERLSRDRSVFESGRSTRAGLELYMQAFPDGEFAAQAKSRLDAIAVIEQRKLSEQQRALQLAEERKQRDAELSRTWVTRFFGYWTKTLLGLNNWGAPIEQVARGNADFSRAFGRPPRPRCTTEECVKSYESAFAVPVPGGTRVERAMRLLLRLRMEEGKLQRAELLLPGSGFSRWQELEERKVVVDGDAEARAQALAWALTRVVPLLDALAPGHQPIEGYAMAPLAPIAFGVTGELTDTTAEDPSAPPNIIQGNVAPGAAPTQPQPTTEQLLQPTAPEPAADLEMETLRVDRQGRAVPSTPQSAAPQPGAAAPVPPSEQQGEMVLEPLAVPRTDGAATAAPSAPAAPAATPAPGTPAPATPATATPTVRAFRAGALRVIVFAASAADPAGMDGVVIERDLAKPASGKRAAPAKSAPRQPAAAAPTPAPAPSH